MFFHPSHKILRFLGLLTLLLLASTTILFVLYSISAISIRSAFPSSCITATALNLTTCLLLIITVIYGSPKRLCLLVGITSTVLAGISSAFALGWMNFRPEGLPKSMYGHPRTLLVVIGFALFVVSLIMQTIFWTLHVTTNPQLGSMPCDEEASPTRPMEKNGIPLALPTTNASQTSLEEKKDRILSRNLQPAPVRPQLRHSSVYYVTSAPAATETPASVEVDHFDTWDTSDVGDIQRAACTLAIAESEGPIMGLGIYTPEIEVTAVDTTEDQVPQDPREVQVCIQIAERQNSPPIPDYDMTPRSANFPTGPLGDNVSSPPTSSTILCRPLAEESEPSDNISQSFIESRGPRGDLGTGKWLVRSQTTL
ncbi:hypothetical protein L873DRAFT_520467 [Choiromyces venosus 120613-1]|uniref:Uncharacterized protein n=1 Tax=Choiromyces venosus 120613-1 TaxID=1336337 RepID=A0A3N4K4X8_9PEZI|nr:hypothetical protein L873DRAFT_520467 [Choiromyces venosus 120613-1]